VTFAQIGEAWGVPSDSIAVLNPELTRATTPPLKGQWLVHLPFGTREKFASLEPDLERSYQAPEPQRFTYKAHRRENLSSIASRYGVSVADLKRWNKIGGKKVRAGRSLVIWGDAPTIGLAVREPPLRADGDGIPERTSWKLKSHKVRRGENLASIARRYGVTSEQLAEWNGLSAGKLKPGKRIYVSAPSEGRTETLPVAVVKPSAPAGPNLHALAEAELMADGQEEPAVENPSVGSTQVPMARPSTHRVRHGETLTGLAARFQLDVADLRSWNHLQSDLLRPGVRLRLHGETAAPEVASVDRVKSAKPARIVRLSGNPQDDPSARTHRIEPGETLESIAHQYGVAVSSLKILNRLRNSRIVAGQKLSIPAGSAKVESRLDVSPAATAQRSLANKPGTTRYIVREGDSLYSIARERSTTVDTLMTLNGLRSAGIRAGQVIEVPMVASR
jgi:membrane-bound lytic murein transglycosylase D